jgi:hypothetical protein
MKSPLYAPREDAELHLGSREIDSRARPGPILIVHLIEECLAVPNLSVDRGDPRLSLNDAQIGVADGEGNAVTLRLSRCPEQAKRSGVVKNVKAESDKHER